MAASTITLKVEGAEEIARAIADRASLFESAISGTAESAKSAEGMTLLILQDHLKSLCAAQLAFLSSEVA